MKSKFFKIIFCACLTFCALLPKTLKIAADTPDASNSVYLYTYNGTTYNQDKRSFLMKMGETEYTTKSVIHNMVVMEIYPYEFYNGDYLKLNFMLDILDSGGNRLEVQSAHFTIYNQNDYTGTLPYALEITESSKNQYSYEYRGKVEDLDKPGNSIRIQIFLKNTNVSTTGIRFLYFNCDMDSEGKTHGFLDSILTMVTHIPEGITNGLKSFLTAISNAVYSIGTSITNALSTVSDAITSALSTVGSAITTALDTVKTGLSDVINTMSTSITNTLSAVSKAITKALTDLGSFLLDGIETLFVPQESYTNEFFNDLNNLLSDNLGLLYYPIEFFIDFMESFENELTDGKAILQWDDIKLSFTSFNGVVIPKGKIDFIEKRRELSNLVPIARTNLSMNELIYYFTDGVLYFALLNLLMRKLKEMMKE